MAKCAKKIKAPKYAFGASEITSLVGGVNNAASTMMSQPTSVLGGAVSGATSGASLGASVGSVIPGVGTAIGGAVGAVGGLISGIFKGKSAKRKQEKLLEQQKEQEQTYRDLQLSNAMNQDYYSQNGYNEYSFANGGVIPTTLAYLDDGELGRTPDGTIFEIPEEHKPEDSNLVDVPVGTQVLSDKLKVPGTNKTFAQEGKRLMKQKKYNNDIYAQNSKRLNNINNQIRYNELLQLQESIKPSNKKKIKGYKNGTPYIDMDLLTPTYSGQFSRNNIGYSFKPEYKTQTQLGQESTNQNKNKFNTLDVIGNIASLGSSLAGAVSNTTAKPELESVYTYTPKFGPTEYNVEPLLQEINKNNAISRYNQSQLGGAGLAYGIQSAVARDRAISQAYDTKRKAENEMSRNNTQMYNQWGQYNAEARHRAAVENSQNRAIAGNINRKGISQLSTIFPSFLKDLRLQNRDKSLLEMMIPYLEYGMTTDQVNNLLKNFG